MGEKLTNQKEPGLGAAGRASGHIVPKEVEIHCEAWVQGMVPDLCTSAEDIYIFDFVADAPSDTWDERIKNQVDIMVSGMQEKAAKYHKNVILRTQISFDPFSSRGTLIELQGRGYLMKEGAA